MWLLELRVCDCGPGIVWKDQPKVAGTTQLWHGATGIPAEQYNHQVFETQAPDRTADPLFSPCMNGDEAIGNVVSRLCNVSRQVR
jgi:hypothetical protein